MGLHIERAGKCRAGPYTERLNDVGKYLRGRAWGALYTRRAFGGRGKSVVTELNMKQVVASATRP